MRPRFDQFVEDFSGAVQLTLDSRIEGDIGLTGMDAEELLINFSNYFSVDFSNFDFDEHFYPEGLGLEEVVLLPIFTIALVLKQLALGISFCCYPSNQEQIRQFNLWRFLSPQGEKADMTVGDLICSAAVGHYNPRHKMHFEISN